MQSEGARRGRRADQGRRPIRPRARPPRPTGAVPADLGRTLLLETGRQVVRGREARRRAAPTGPAARHQGRGERPVGGPDEADRKREGRFGRSDRRPTLARQAYGLVGRLSGADGCRRAGGTDGRVDRQSLRESVRRVRVDAGPTPGRGRRRRVAGWPARGPGGRRHRAADLQPLRRRPQGVRELAVPVRAGRGQPVRPTPQAERGDRRAARPAGVFGRRVGRLGRRCPVRPVRPGREWTRPGGAVPDRRNDRVAGVRVGQPHARIVHARGRAADGVRPRRLRQEPPGRRAAVTPGARSGAGRVAGREAGRGTRLAGQVGGAPDGRQDPGPRLGRRPRRVGRRRHRPGRPGGP